MDFESALKAGGASATMIAIAGIAYKILRSFCGNRLRSECCEHEASVGVTVEQMTPRGPRPSIEVRVVPDMPAPPADRDAPSKKADSRPVSHTSSPVSAAAHGKDEPPMPPLAI